MGLVSWPRSEPQTILELNKVIKQIIRALNGLLDFSNLGLGAIGTENLAPFTPDGVDAILPPGSIPSFKLQFRIVTVEGDTWTDNSPSAGSVAWTACGLTYKGKVYGIAAGNTANKWIYWALAAPASFSSSATFPSLGDDDFLIAVNNGGLHDLVWNSPVATKVITTALIEDAAIKTALIDDLAVTNAKIESLVAEKVTAGILIGHIIKTASSGQRVVINETANTVEFYDTGGILRGRIEGLPYAVRHRIYESPTNYWDTLFNMPGVGAIANFADIKLAQSGQYEFSTAKQIVTGQWGSHSFGSVGAGATASYAVTFPTSFLITPKPIVGVTAGDVAHAGFAESTTGFTLWIRNNGPTQNVVAHWLAVGS